MTQTALKYNPSDLKRVEDKLDKIIQHFNIGERPTRSNKDLDEKADAVVLDFLKKEGNHGG